LSLGTHLLITLVFLWRVQLDGFVARKLGVNSVLGSYLDPLADKVSLFTAASIF
jgi:phosphatidylglycerophosphate synthase